jgi:serine/threonine protein kinase
VEQRVCLCLIINSDYIAPEVFQCKPYDYTCDLYALGGIIYFILSKLDPSFFRFDFSKILDKNQSEFANEMILLIQNLTQANPSERWSLLNVVDYLQGDQSKLQFCKKELSIEKISQTPLITESKMTEKPKSTVFGFFSKKPLEKPKPTDSEKKKALEYVKMDGKNLQNVIDSFKNDFDIVYEAVKKDGLSLQFASKELKNNRKIVSMAIKNWTAFEFASDELKNDEKIFLEVIKNTKLPLSLSILSRFLPLSMMPEYQTPLQFASKEIQNNKNLVLISIKANGMAFNHASQELQKDGDVILAFLKVRRTSDTNISEIKCGPDVMCKLVSFKGDILKYASEEYKNNPSIVLSAVKQNGISLKYASNELRNNLKIVLAAVKSDGLSLEYASEELRNNQDIVLNAVKKSESSLIFASETLKNDKKIVLTAIMKKGNLLKHASDGLRNDQELVLVAVKNDGNALEFASENLKNNEKIISIAIQNGVFLKFIPKKLQTREIVLFTVENQKLTSFDDLSDEFKEDKEIILKGLCNKCHDIQFLSKKLLNDEEIILKSIVYKKNNIIYASDELKNDVEFFKSVLDVHIFLIEFAPDKIKNNREISKMVVKYGELLEYLSKEMQNEPEIVFSAIKSCTSAFEFASDELKNDKNFVKRCFNHSNFSLIFSPLSKDENFCFELFEDSIQHFNFISPSLKSSKSFLFKCLKIDVKMFNLFDQSIKDDKDFIKKSMEIDLGILKFISSNYLNDKSFALELVGINGNALEYLSNNLRNDFDIVKNAVTTTEESFIFASTEIQYLGISKKYETVKKLAEGGEGIIYLVKKNEKLFAEKRIKTNSLKEMNSIMFEFSKILSLKNDHIFQIEEILQDTNEITGFTLIRIIMKLYDGDLSNYVQNHKLSETMIIQFSLQMLKGLKYLHSNNFIHGDLKLENIFYLKNGNEIELKIGDFGINNSKDYEFYGSITNIAPEIVLKDAKHDEKSDIFSFGGMMYQMMNSSEEILYISSFKNEIQFNNQKKYSQSLKDLVVNLLSFDPKKRKSLEEIESILNSLI